jgi:hypothetical protein
MSGNEVRGFFLFPFGFRVRTTLALDDGLAE